MEGKPNRAHRIHAWHIVWDIVRVYRRDAGHTNAEHPQLGRGARRGTGVVGPPRTLSIGDGESDVKDSHTSA